MLENTTSKIVGEGKVQGTTAALNEDIKKGVRLRKVRCFTFSRHTEGKQSITIVLHSPNPTILPVGTGLT